MSKKIILIGVGVVILILAGVFILVQPKQMPSEVTTLPTAPYPSDEKHITKPTPVKLSKIPPSAEIVYHKDSYIYVMDANGGNVTQITFENPRRWEHVAVSHNHRYVVADEVRQAASGGDQMMLWVFNLEKGTEAQLVPAFESAGGGGVDWDPQGYIYFAGQEKKPEMPTQVSSPQDLLRALLGTFEVYKIKPDGTGLKKVTDDSAIGAADVAVSEDGKKVVFTTAISGEGASVQIHTVNADGTNLKKVPNVFGHDPEFSPDGKKIIYTAPNAEDTGEEKNQQLWIANIDGTNIVRITPKEEWVLAPDWIEDTILYTAVKNAVLITPEGTGAKTTKEDALFSKWIPSK